MAASACPLPNSSLGANRMRERQRKQSFEVSSGQVAESLDAPKGHPLFWEATPPNHASEGFASPKNDKGA